MTGYEIYRNGTEHFSLRNLDSVLEHDWYGISDAEDVQLAQVLEPQLFEDIESVGLSVGTAQHWLDSQEGAAFELTSDQIESLGLDPYVWTV